MIKKILITEQQFTIISNYLFENDYDEGFGFYDNQTKMRYEPENNKHSNTNLKRGDGSFNPVETTLPKSGVKVINIYELNKSLVTRALKHGLNQDFEKIEMDPSMNEFNNKTYLYIYHLLKNRNIDYIVSPESSSKFNENVLQQIHKRFGNTPGIKLLPNFLSKTVESIIINKDYAKNVVGLTDDEIYSLIQKVEKWKRDDQRKDILRQIEELKKEVSEYKTNRGRGRVSNDIKNKSQDIVRLQYQANQLRAGDRGPDPLKGRNGLGNWQIKGVEDRERRSLENIFSIAKPYQEMMYKLRGKDVICWDDNYSSGATLDDACLALQKMGVGSLLAMTLGTMDITTYAPSQRRR